MTNTPSNSSANPRGATAGATGPAHRLAWLDMMKALALGWVFLNHVAERIFGYPLIANPAVDWPPFAARVSQLAPLSGYGLGDFPVNLLRYLGWAGDQGVQIFLVASGFGLTLAMLKRHGHGRLPIGAFFARRAERLYPLWWGSHIGFAALGLLTGWAVLIFDPRFYLSLLGMRITGALFYFFSPAWWYFGLAVQLYLVFPALWEALRRWGPRRLLLLSCAVGFTARALGLLFLGTYMDAWLRGSVFLTRLPDFVFGVAIAAWMFEAPEKTDRQLRKGTSLILAVLAYAAATGLSLTGPGMTVAPFLQAAALFVLLYAALSRVDTARPCLRPWVWVGEHSYSLYLVHHPWILMVLPLGVAVGSQAGLATLLALALTLVSAPALELGVNWTQGILSHWRQKAGWGGLALRLILVATSAAGLLLAGELTVRWLDPQEVLGWGERPSLEPDLDLGWRLNPSQTTHLRWDSYDYQVTSNGLGFPGPAYTQATKPGTLRVLVTGDAFSSAEGVDTELAWPRLLEGMLAESLGRPVEVLNLSITGYGPEQYADAVTRLGPEFVPEVILVATSVNDFQDVLQSTSDFRRSIGFDQPDPAGWRQVLSLAHLRRWTRVQVYEPLREIARGEPRAQGYFFGSFQALETGRAEIEGEGARRTELQLGRITQLANQIEAHVVLVMAPAAVQICGPRDLAYFPRSVDLSDRSRFDLDLPQRLMEGVARHLNVPFLDLRPALRAMDACPYQPRNMHWLVMGHRAIAEYLSEALTSGSVLPGLIG